MARAPRLRWAFPTAVAMRVAQRKPGHVRPHQQVAPPRPALPPHTHASPAVKLRLSRTHTRTHATPHAMKLRLSYAAMKLRPSQTHTHATLRAMKLRLSYSAVKLRLSHTHTPPTAVKLRLSLAMRLRPSHTTARLSPCLLQHTHLDVYHLPGGSAFDTSQIIRE